ncbi:MAG: hypothetical protein ACD_17C00436G0001 [uncultured bacterium]|nr:MAG: hypothetical protein ACD_17C00436G0001 [uncultured bacterium]OGN55704.1 MAG: hypothetical protein A2796_00850 [Chlamydiae bacterium RIFCSPHIGHO2_01_FULL_44_39]OGN60496.1 MAG: hypothetical protein A3D96_01275 [Chlamydiae bacterium RIFCSPHIGHO2_12_FULL_44_59]OGN65950.1 MAG: hypothetical protein A2978_04565 [Chlamydiae bacterium RIFCSPLOWO2_01_FULL_44_52]OGN68765.1 MAG: hypothetical protein A3I67_00225 [Chlamydiae bacterium RIFCSPLOWO2_02_FULL_45_22]OGN70406.1 MAG: hypothetical protein A3
MYTRASPYYATLKTKKLLTGAGSSKKTYHLELEADTSKLAYRVGDSIAVLPSNRPQLVDAILKKLHATGDEEVWDEKSGIPLPFREYLLKKANLQRCSFHKLYPVEKTAAPLLELLEHHKPHPSELARVLLPLMPRFYSIANSAKVFSNEIHLLIAFVEYDLRGEKQYGVGSHFLCREAKIGLTPIPIYVQPSNHFALPEDPNALIILIGPGTGIAPFRAFLQERIATQAEGQNWIFFGERNRATDFHYGDYWLELEKQGRLRLSTAFSRDQEQKIYVQHKLWEERKSIWKWICDGAFLYVCGDAKEMAKDVDLTLEKIIHEEGNMTEEEARLFLRAMRHNKRYLLDVYLS